MARRVIVRNRGYRHYLERENGAQKWARASRVRRKVLHAKQRRAPVDPRSSAAAATVHNGASKGQSGQKKAGS